MKEFLLITVKAFLIVKWLVSPARSFQVSNTLIWISDYWFIQTIGPVLVLLVIIKRLNSARVVLRAGTWMVNILTQLIFKLDFNLKTEGRRSKREGLEMWRKTIVSRKRLGRSDRKDNKSCTISETFFLSYSVLIIFLIDFQKLAVFSYPNFKTTFIHFARYLKSGFGSGHGTRKFAQKTWLNSNPSEGKKKKFSPP